MFGCKYYIYAFCLNVEGVDSFPQKTYVNSKVKVKFSLPTPWRHMGGVEIQVHSFLTSALDEGEWLTSRPSCFIPLN